MSFELVTRPPCDGDLSVWSDLPGVDAVSDRLSREDQDFFAAVGEYLAEMGQTDRLGLALLHSHFPVGREEVLVDRSAGDRDEILTSVHGVHAIENDAAFVPNSWMFDQHATADDIEHLHIITWAQRDGLELRPLDNEDSDLMHGLGSLFRQFQATRRFGMTLVDHAPAEGKIWTEGEWVDRRELLREQLPLAEVQSRDPLMTVWTFDSGGKSFKGRGCCIPRPAHQGHSTRPHPGG